MVEAKAGGSTAAGVLAGVRVVELSRRMAAPLVGMLLGEQGAEVVRVVDPAAPAADPVLDAMLARGKTEVTLDLTVPANRAVLARLLAHADVVVEDAVAVGAAAGLDYDAVRAAGNPGLIDCCIPAFPAGDPRAAQPDHEALVGMAGFLYAKPIGAPVLHDFPVASIMAGLFAASAVVAALIARLRTGQGQHVESSLFQSALFAQILFVLIKTGVPRGFLPLKMVATPFMGAWRCQDGRYVYLHITLPAHAARILDALEAAGLAAEVRALRAAISPATMRDPSQVKSVAEAKKIKRVFERVFLARPADEWERLVGRDLCCIAVRTVDEWVRDSMAAGMSDACEVDDPVFGPLTAPGPGVTVVEQPPTLRPRSRGDDALPALRARWEADPRKAPATPGPATPLQHPLAGVRVADLSRIIAGPCAARVLAELGAEVLSIQSPTDLDWALSFHLLFNAGKRSVTLDFNSDEGKKTLWAILTDFAPHALVQNYRHLELAREIGIDPEAVRAHFPDIVYMHLNAYGNAGVWKDRPGFEQVVQAVSGIQMSYGHDGRPKLLPTPVIDIGSGLLGAFATLLGLYRQTETGRGLLATTHLTRVSVLLQLGSVAASQRARCLRTARERGHAPSYDPGREVVARLVRTREGHACAAGPRAALETWRAHLGAPRTDDPLADVARHLHKATLSEWRRTLAAAGVDRSVGVVLAPRGAELVEDGAIAAPLHKRAFPGCAKPLTFVPSAFRLALTPRVDVPAPNLRGAATREVLARVGIAVPEGTGIIPYPANKPLLPWLFSLLRWGYYAWRSGNV